jgi:hypothetical protein
MVLTKSSRPNSRPGVAPQPLLIKSLSWACSTLGEIVHLLRDNEFFFVSDFLPIIFLAVRLLLAMRKKGSFLFREYKVPNRSEI